MRKPLLLLLLALSLLPFPAGAHGDLYLEFNPDRSNSVRIADGSVPSQVFYAQNDFLSGFDFYVANPGSGGTASFSLLNEQGIVIATRILSIPYVALTANGTKFHLDFNSQLPVLADSKYSIRITSSMPELRLYNGDRVRIVSHNAPFVSEYLTGVAKLGEEEQPFSFKYALYEVGETSAPIISNVAWTVMSPSQMRIDFNANEAVDYRIEYGPAGYSQSTNFLNTEQFCTEGISLCSITVAVSPDTEYQYRLTVKDIWNNQSQTTGTFVSGEAQAPSTAPTPLPQAPLISNLRIAEVTNNSVKVAWTTDEVSNSRLIVKESFQGVVITGVSDSTFELEHVLITEPVLYSGAGFIAEAVSTDLDSNESTASISFTTLAYVPTPSPTATPAVTPIVTPPPLTSPGVSPLATVAPSSTPQTSSTPVQTGINVSSEPSAGGGGTGSVRWSKPADGAPQDGYRIDVFDNNGKLVKTVFAPKDSNEAGIPGLENGEYNVIVYANNGGVFEKVDKPAKLAVSDDTFLNRLLALWPYLLIPAALGGILGWLRLKKNKNVNIKIQNDKNVIV